MLPCILCAVQAKASFRGNCTAVKKSFFDDGFFDKLNRNSILEIGVTGILGNLCCSKTEFFFRCIENHSNNNDGNKV